MIHIMLSFTRSLLGSDLPPSLDTCDLQFKGGTLVIRPLVADLSQHVTPPISERTAEAIDAVQAHLRRLVIDLERVQAISSIGHGFCIDARNQVHRFGAPTGLVGVGNDIREVIRLMKVERLFTMLYSEDDQARFLA